MGHLLTLFLVAEPSSLSPVLTLRSPGLSGSECSGSPGVQELSALQHVALGHKSSSNEELHALVTFLVDAQPFKKDYSTPQS